jgi:hypothetical protein
MSRSFGPEEFACVKATSFVSEIAAELVPPSQRALFMFASPRNYIASILAGENSVRELHALAPSRAERLQRRAPVVQPSRNEAELAAVAWACEMTALEAAAAAMPDRKIEWADFDVMLGDMPSELARVAAFFGAATETETIRGIAEGALMKRYSKALEYDYTAQLRRDLINETTVHCRPAIDGAIEMLGSAAQQSPLLASAMARAGGI